MTGAKRGTEATLHGRFMKMLSDVGVRDIRRSVDSSMGAMWKDVVRQAYQQVVTDEASLVKAVSELHQTFPQLRPSFELVLQRCTPFFRGDIVKRLEETMARRDFAAALELASLPPLRLPTTDGGAIPPPDDPGTQWKVWLCDVVEQRLEVSTELRGTPRRATRIAMEVASFVKDAGPDVLEAVEFVTSMNHVVIWEGWWDVRTSLLHRHVRPLVVEVMSRHLKSGTFEEVGTLEAAWNAVLAGTAASSLVPLLAEPPPPPTRKKTRKRKT